MRVYAKRAVKAFMLFFFVINFSWAWDGICTGTISGINTVANEANNFELRVFLNGAQMCNNTDPNMNGWGYLNASDQNYKVTVANLMLAYATGKTVTIYTMNEGQGCHIHYVAVRG